MCPQQASDPVLNVLVSGARPLAGDQITRVEPSQWDQRLRRRGPRELPAPFSMHGHSGKRHPRARKQVLPRLGTSLPCWHLGLGLAVPRAGPWCRGHCGQPAGLSGRGVTLAWAPACMCRALVGTRAPTSCSTHEPGCPVGASDVAEGVRESLRSGADAGQPPPRLVVLGCRAVDSRPQPHPLCFPFPFSRPRVPAGPPTRGPRPRPPSPRLRKRRRKRGSPGSLPKSSRLPSSTGRTVSLPPQAPKLGHAVVRVGDVSPAAGQLASQGSAPEADLLLVVTVLTGAARPSGASSNARAAPGPRVCSQVCCLSPPAHLSRTFCGDGSTLLAVTCATSLVWGETKELALVSFSLTLSARGRPTRGQWLLRWRVRLRGLGSSSCRVHQAQDLSLPRGSLFSCGLRATSPGVTKACLWRVVERLCWQRSQSHGPMAPSPAPLGSPGTGQGYAPCSLHL